MENKSCYEEIKRVSDSITNMVALDASYVELERVIDSFKCELRCKQSKIDNDIKQLEEKYGDEV